MHLDTGKGDGPDAESREAEFVEGLRRSSADALEKAYGFLGQQDDRWAMLRADTWCSPMAANRASRST